MVLLVILQDEFSGQVLLIEKGALSLPCSLKRNMALLGSNHVRNRAAAQDAEQWGGSSPPFSSTTGMSYICGESPHGA